MHEKIRMEFESQGAASFMVYHLAPSEQIDEMGIGMISNNEIDGMLPFAKIQVDDKKSFRFNINGKISLSQI